MATTLDYIEFVCEQIQGVGEVRYKKMFGEYIAYVNDKPLLLVCNNTVYIKMLDCVSNLMQDADCGLPYKGAKPHYMLDVENRDLMLAVVVQLEKVVLVPTPKPRKRK